MLGRKLWTLVDVCIPLSSSALRSNSQLPDGRHVLASGGRKGKRDPQSRDNFAVPDLSGCHLASITAHCKAGYVVSSGVRHRQHVHCGDGPRISEFLSLPSSAATRCVFWLSEWKTDGVTLTDRIPALQEDGASASRFPRQTPTRGSFPYGVFFFFSPFSFRSGRRFSRVRKNSPTLLRQTLSFSCLAFFLRSFPRRLFRFFFYLDKGRANKTNKKRVRFQPRPHSDNEMCLSGALQEFRSFRVGFLTEVILLYRVGT